MSIDTIALTPPQSRPVLGPAPVVEDQSWARPALLGLLAATALLYLWGLGASGWANSFYSAAAQAGADSWKAFFFGSSDAASSITVDKPPMALWLMALSVRVFGLSSWSILVPQALLGVASVGLLHSTVRRTTGSAAAGLIAGAVLALTPVAVLMFRFNNPDALLVLLLIGSVACTLRALESPRAVRWLALGGALVGFAFLTKMLQAFLVLPALAAVYLLAAHTPVGKRIGHLLVAFGSMLLAAGWWVAIVELWPASSRPYIGGSQNNSILELTLGYNGLGRLTGNEVGSVGGGGTGTGMWGETGILRMFNSEIGGQIGWLMPAALILLGAGLWFTRRAPRTDLQRAGLVVWGGWLVVTALTFSFMAGIFHAYYTVALAPAIGALVGIGATLLWSRRDSYAAAPVMAGTLAFTTAFGFVLLDRTPDYHPWLTWAVAVIGLGAAVLLVGVRHLSQRLALVVAGAALVAGLAAPTSYALPPPAPRTPARSRRPGPSSGGGGPGAPDDRWSARGQPVLGTDHLDAPDRRGLLHLDGGRHRLQLRGGLPAREPAAGDGDRRLQRQRPEPDTRAVPGRRRQRRDPLLHRRRRRLRRTGWRRLRQRQRRGDLHVGRGELHRDDGRRGDDLRPVHGCPVSAPATEPRPDRLPLDAPALDVVIPVHNEEVALARSVARVHDHLSRLPYTFRITIADNASTDGTALVAHRLSHEYDAVRAVFLPEKGRGRALKQVWSMSCSKVLVYMDVDLSTDLNALLPLVAPLLSGHSDVAIGSRLTRGSRTRRGPRRELISRGYNLLLRGTLRRAVLRRAVRLQGDPLRRRPRAAPDGRGLRLVLRHRAARARGARRSPHPRGAGRLGGRPRQPGRHLADRPGRRTRHRPAGHALLRGTMPLAEVSERLGRRTSGRARRVHGHAGRAVRGHRGVLHRGVRRGLPAAPPPAQPVRRQRDCARR